MSEDRLDITPDPNVLLALTHTPLKPLDALCELIDNGIDSFRAATLGGVPVKHPLLQITIPGASETRRGEGLFRVCDNGPGLSRIQLEQAIKAGYSGKNRFDTLGLFGMGFNIATGKLGTKTVVTTSKASDDYAMKVVIDLPKVVSSKSYLVPVEKIPKPKELFQGTIIEVAGLWPDGNANAGFSMKLAGLPKNQLSDQISRRYATILREDGDDRIRIVINGEPPLQAFEHCAWGAHRFVERRTAGKIPARIDVNYVVHTEKRCVYDGNVLNLDTNRCAECDRSEFRTIEERVKGWIGVQRFDNQNSFGIDLVRNGRAIRVAEKDAFFSFRDDFNEESKEYPVDSQFGRIIGEIRLDHVPVDFQKQDFQRSSAEWQRAIDFLRGKSLFPSKWNEGERNDSPVSRIFQGYRRVRNFGKDDMYMGRYDERTGKADRIDRDTEVDFYSKFLKRLPDFYDDAAWWELVETATTPPLLRFEECASCGFQNRPDAESCEGCGVILKSKPCINCQELIVESAVQCQKCGASQVPEVEEPWICQVCNGTNGIQSERCETCSAIRGAESPVAPEVLRRSGVILNELSFKSKIFEMADGRQSESVDVKCFSVGSLRPRWNGPAIPTISLRSIGEIQLFIDLQHPVFSKLGVKPEEAVATEAAQYLYNLRTDLNGRPAHSIHNIASGILMEVWGDQLSVTPQKLCEQIKALFGDIAEKLVLNPDVADFYDDLDQYEHRELAERLIGANLLEKISELKQTGGYLRYVSPAVLAKFFSKRPEAWFGSVWNEKLADPDTVGEEAAKASRLMTLGNYSRCLSECAEYIRYTSDSPLILLRANASRRFLEDRLT